jgi:hypothetical protein
MAASRRVLCYAAVLVLAVSLVGLAPVGAATTPPDTVRDVRFADHIDYERAVIDLGSRQESADLAPSYRSSYRDGDWVVRISLPTTGRTLTTGGVGLGGAISRYHVVRSRRGSLSVYFHLTGAASSVDTFELNHPARVVMDVSGGGKALYAKPAVGANTVILTPRADRSVGSGTFMVRGYGRPFEGRGAWRVKDASAKVVGRGTYATSDWATTWGAFAFRVTYPQRLAGTKGTLEVGQYSPSDGAFKGASVPLSFR